MHIYHEQKKCICQHLIKPRRVKVHTFISRLQELNTYLGKFPPYIEGQETVSLPTDEIMAIMHQMIEQGFNYANPTVKEETDFLKT